MTKLKKVILSNTILFNNDIKLDSNDDGTILKSFSKFFWSNYSSESDWHWYSKIN